MSEFRRRPRREALAFEARFAGSTEADGTFSGHAAVFGEADAYGDTIRPGAFARSLAEHRGRGTRPLMLWSHDPAEPVGIWQELAEDAKGLKVKGQLVLETARGKEAYALLRAGALDGLSIGFRARSAERGPNGGRVVTDIELIEISLVAIPAAGRARITQVRSAGRPSNGLNSFIKAVGRARHALEGTRQ